MSAALTRLPIVVLNVYSRCNCRCGMCDIWKITDSREMSVAFLQNHLDAFEDFGVKWVVLTGGEPLMHSNLFVICDALRERSIRVTVLTSGLLVARYASEVARRVDDLVVSLDGPPDLHDQIRNVPGAFDSVVRGISAVRSFRPDFSVTARCTVQKANHARLQETVVAAGDVGVNSVSFLAVDVNSAAFGRLVTWPAARQDGLILSEEEVGALEREMQLLPTHPLVADTPEHLQRIVDRFRAYAGIGPHAAPRCNAPWVSAVIDVDGQVRPCFFHQPMAHMSDGLGAAINGDAARRFRRSLDVATNETCRRCVCSLFYSGSTAS